MKRVEIRVIMTCNIRNKDTLSSVAEDVRLTLEREFDHMLEKRTNISVLVKEKK